jgi:hypothetical protein
MDTGRSLIKQPPAPQVPSVPKTRHEQEQDEAISWERVNLNIYNNDDADDGDADDGDDDEAISWERVTFYTSQLRSIDTTDIDTNQPAEVDDSVMTVVEASPFPGKVCVTTLGSFDMSEILDATVS